MNDREMESMLIEYMGKGFLENIVALFKQEPGLMRFIPAMAASEEMTVRLGTTALVEEMAGGHRASLRAVVPGLLGLLTNENPTVRGDAAYLLGLIGGPAAAEGLRRLGSDTNAAVREIAADALSDIEMEKSGGAGAEGPVVGPTAGPTPGGNGRSAPR